MLKAEWWYGSAAQERARRVQTAGAIVLRYGLAGLIFWFGAFKFTSAEASAIEPLLAHSPLLAWLYGVTDVRGASRLIGSAEMIIAVLLTLKPIAPRLATLGALGALGMFVTTLSFLVSTPGTLAIVEGFPAPAGPGGFLVKDVVLLGAAAYAAGESLQAVAMSAAGARQDRRAREKDHPAVRTPEQIPG